MNVNKTLGETLELNTRPRAYSNSSSSSSSLASPISSNTPWTTSPVGQSNLISSSRRPSIGSVVNSSDTSVSTSRRGSVGPTSPALRATSFRSAHAKPRGTANPTPSGNASINTSSSSNTNTSSSPPLLPSQTLNSSLTNGTKAIQFTSTTGYYKPPPPSTIAATAAAHAAKPKESALSKAKMFALQATKPHLSSSSLQSKTSGISSKKKADLTIQPISQLPRTSISERSPLTRPSKELERIALLGSQTLSPMASSSSYGYSDLASTSSITGSSSSKHKPYYHLSFRPGKNVHGSTVLSSSSSNSKLVSEQGSIYSFHPSSPGGIHKSLSALELKNGGKDFDRDQIADESWILLRSRVLPLYQGEGLRIPVEDLNDLVVMHLNFRIQGGVQAVEILNEFKELTKVGMLKLDTALQKVHSTPSKFLPRVVEVWQFFFSQVLPYWEAVFLPLQLEFDCCGQVLSPHSAKEYWGTVMGAPETLNVNRMTLMGFRDWVIIPVADKLKNLITQSLEDDSFMGENGKSNGAAATGIGVNTSTNRTVIDAAVRLFQCTSILASIHSDDENQLIVESLVKAIKNGWMNRPGALNK